MKFSHWCFRTVLIAFAVLGCTGFYPSGHLTVKPSVTCRVHGFILLLTFFAYYCYTYNDTNKFFLKTGGKLSLVFFEFCLYWFVSLVTFAATIWNGGKIAVWFKRVMNIRGFKSENTSSLLITLTLNSAVYLVLLPTYVFTSTKTRNQPSLAPGPTVLYLTLCGISAVITLEIMMGKSFLAFLLRDLDLKLTQTLRSDSPFDETRAGKGFRVKNLREIMRSHYEISMLDIEFNNLFSIQVLLFTLLNFVELTYSIYYLISSAGFGDLFLSIKLRTIFGISYFILYLLQFLQYTISYESVKNQKIHHTLVSSLSDIDGDDGDLQHAVETFLFQCANISVDGSAAGFFQVGHNLLRQMFGIVTSALIILIQFEQFVSNTLNCQKST